MSAPLSLLQMFPLDIVAAGGVAQPRIINELMVRYYEKHRRYHGREHLEALFRLLQQHASLIAAGTPSRFAVWWHDAIYDPQARDNEERSADLARENMRDLGISESIIDETVRLILMTKNHWNGPSAGDGDYFLDADIAILGAPPAVYDRYAANVRQEYSFAPDDLYRAGRSAFLKSASGRPRLFRTDVFETTYAAQARANMQRELTSLAGPPP